jgi:hypothetical protein
MAMLFSLFGRHLNRGALRKQAAMARRFPYAGVAQQARGREVPLLGENLIIVNYIISLEGGADLGPNPRPRHRLLSAMTGTEWRNFSGAVLPPCDEKTPHPQRQTPGRPQGPQWRALDLFQ